MVEIKVVLVVVDYAGGVFRASQTGEVQGLVQVVYTRGFYYQCSRKAALQTECTFCIIDEKYTKSTRERIVRRCMFPVVIWEMMKDQ